MIRAGWLSGCSGAGCGLIPGKYDTTFDRKQAILDGCRKRPVKGICAIKAKENAGVADEVRMSLFTWQPKFSVHHDLIDEQHRGLFRAAEDLHAAMLRGAGRNVIAATLDSLLDYTQKHFRDEEQLMVKNKYPQYAQHKAEHDKFTQRVRQLKTDLANNQAAITVAVMQFVSDWLKNHIVGNDTKIAQHIASSGKARVA